MPKNNTAKNTPTGWNAADELDRRDYNRPLPKGEHAKAPRTESGKRLIMLSTAALVAECVQNGLTYRDPNTGNYVTPVAPITEVPATNVQVVPVDEPVRTLPTFAAFMVPGPRGGDPIKRLRREVATILAGGMVYPHKDNRAAYSLTADMSVEDMGAMLREAGIVA